MLAFPILLDLVAMIQGSGEIYKHVTTGWFNGRYLVFVAPLFAFSCTAIVVFAASFGKKVPNCLFRINCTFVLWNFDDNASFTGWIY